MTQLFKFYDAAKKLLLFALLLPCFACAEDPILPKIPLTLNPYILANPISLATSATRQRLYVVNSNNRVAWEDASLLVMDLANPVAPQAIFVVGLPNFSGQAILDDANGFLYLPNRKSNEESD